MVFAAGVFAAVCLGLGWVLQQRIAAHAAASELLSLRLLGFLMRKPVWWGGIAAMIVGQVLGAVALQLGAVTLVEPLLSTNLLFAFIIAAVVARQRVRWFDVVGAALLSAALGVFIVVGKPHAHNGPLPVTWKVLLTVAIISLVAFGLIAIGKRRRQTTEAVLVATAVGLLYGFEDAGTRGTLLSFDHGGILGLVASPWPYLVIAAAIVGIFFMQSAFGAARLELSLPPTSAAEPITGVAIGVGVLGSSVSVSSLALAVQGMCLAAMIGGVVIIGRSDTMARSAAEHLRAARQS